MGPLLPILILLFWQSPSTFERLAFEGRFPNAQLAYVATETWGGERPVAESSEIREYSRAVVRALQSARVEVVQAAEEIPLESFLLPEAPHANVHSGYPTSQRSRDGPR